MLSIRISFTAKPQCLELPWEIEITTSYKGFELKDQKHSIKEVLYLYKFHWKISRNLRKVPELAGVLSQRGFEL